MTEGTRTLYHGTSRNIIGNNVLNGVEPLIGKCISDNPGWSGSLTNDKDFAIYWANRRGPEPLLLTYVLPGNIVVDEGIIGLRPSSRGYITTLEIAVKDLPRSYIQALLYFSLIHENTAELQVMRGQMSFHSVPFMYLSSAENV